MHPDRPSSEVAQKNGLTPGEGLWRIVEKGWAQDAEARGSVDKWVEAWTEGMRERDELLETETTVAGGSSGVGSSSSAGATGGSAIAGGKNVFGQSMSSSLAKKSTHIDIFGSRLRSHR